VETRVRLVAPLDVFAWQHHHQPGRGPGFEPEQELRAVRKRLSFRTSMTPAGSGACVSSRQGATALGPIPAYRQLEREPIDHLLRYSQRHSTAAASTQAAPSS